MELPKRKSPRLPGYDYSRKGYYFVTICVRQKRCILSRVVGRGLAPAEICLTKYGEAAKKELLALESRYPDVRIDKYVIMPNHIHAILYLDDAAGASPRPTLMDVVCAFKSLTTRCCGTSLFQTSFHDHVIRGEEDYRKIWEYIDTNPNKWAEDCFYTK